jgi:hypothetical protein
MTDEEKKLIPAWRLRAFVSEHLHGGCKVLSQGSVCECPLCDLDRLYDALRWYGDEAEALAANLAAKKDMAILASVLDAGKRTANALGSNVKVSGPEAALSPEGPARTQG